VVESIEDHKKIGSLDRWNTAFWLKWKNEYLYTLQQRYKWEKAVPNIEIG